MPVNRIQPPSLILSALMLGMLGVAAGCAQTTNSQATEAPSPQSFPPVSPPSPQAVPPPSDPLVEAEDIAQGAIAMTQSAVSPEDWQRVIQQWERAISLMESVPNSDPQKAVAQEKVAAYKQNLANARQASRKQQPSTQSGTVPQGTIAIAKSSSQAKSDGDDSKAKKSNATTSPEASPSDPKLALAQHLNNSGAKMYGTFWCGACGYQREQFGPAFSEVVEIECDPRGKNPQAEACKQAGIKAYPTWEIKGQLYQGARSLDELAQLSGYGGNLKIVNDE